MKKYFLGFVLLGIFISQGFGQTNKSVVIDSKEYEQMKKSGTSMSGVKLINPQSFAPSLEDLKQMGPVHKLPTGGAGCSCYITPDASYTLAMTPNDDGSTASIPIPFTFCLYGSNYTNLFINNNGNISFGMSYPTFSSNPFPDPDYIMVAPFWGDVDTRGTGTVKYKITPTAMYVNWDAVGYYNSETDKVNTFQLIITDGTDPILPAGNNIAFCYGDMQWTTGAASGGVGGFGAGIVGAIPSTVGVNKGDGINYIQMGRFDQPGLAYDGGYGANDGVSWLDYQSLYFNVCSGSNIAPIASGLNNCDTIKICASGDTLILNGLFLSPEIGQNTVLGINLNSTPGATIVSNTPGNSALGQVQIIASVANAGNNVITFTATDNGTPAQTTVINVNIFVDTTGLFAFNPVISGNLEFCEGSTSTLSVTPTTLDSYTWSTGSTATSIVVDTTGQYWVTTTKNGCYKTNMVDVIVHPLPTPIIAGYPYACGGSTTIYADSSIYASYSWSNGSVNDSITVGLGTYTLTVTDTNGCTATSPPVTVTAPVPPVISGITAICNGDSAVLSTTIPYVSYSWSTGSTSDTITVGATGSYSVTVVDINGCTINSAPFNVSTFNYTLTAGGVTNFCSNDSILLTATGAPAAGASYTWSNGDNTNSTYVNTGGNINVTVTYTNGCSADTTMLVPNPYLAPTPLIAGYPYACGGSANLYSDSLLYTTYSWSTGSTNDSVTVGFGTYSLTVTDPSGCTATSAPVTVTVPVPPVITGVSAICNGQATTLSTTMPFVSYNWSTTAVDSSIVVTLPGPYTVTVVDPSGCTITSDTFNVSVFNFTLNASGIANYCFGNSITLTASASPLTGATFAWSTGSTASSIFVNSGGAYTVVLEYPANGCITSTTLNAPAPNPLPTPEITGLLFTCGASTTTLSADSTTLYTAYSWTGGGSASSLQSNAGTYTVTVTDLNGCVGTSPPVTVVNANPSVTVLGAATFCPGDSAILYADVNIPTGANYLWTTTDTSQSITVSGAGTYGVTITYSNGCTAGDSAIVGVYDVPEANYTVLPVGTAFRETPVSFTDASSITTGTVTNWYWNFGDTSSDSVSFLENPSHTYSENGVYQVMLAVQSNNGCWDTIRYDYTIISDILVPNVFTPNGDGKNDLLEFKNLQFFPSTSLTVFNRWGKKIYKSSDYQNNWTGDGHSDGVYFFVLDGPNLKQPEKGFVQIFNER